MYQCNGWRYETPCCELLELIQEENFLDSSKILTPVYGDAKHAGDDLAGGDDDSYSL